MTVYRLPPAIESYLATLPSHTPTNPSVADHFKVETPTIDHNQGEHMNGNEKSNGIFSEFLGYVNGFANDPIAELEREFGKRDEGNDEGNDEGKRVSFVANGKRSAKPTQPASTAKRADESGTDDNRTKETTRATAGNQEQKDDGNSEA